jgi:hypothetical protein
MLYLAASKSIFRFPTHTLIWTGSSKAAFKDRNDSINGRPFFLLLPHDLGKTACKAIVIL